jgi:hypothetical protein
MKHSHPYIVGIKHRFSITPLLQSHLLEFSNNLPFERAVSLLSTAIPSAQTSSSQAQRLTQYFGSLEEMEELLQKPGFGTVESKDNSAVEVLYVQADGGHLSTDDGYRETKVGRLFAAHQIEKISSDNEDVELRRSIERSDYLAHLGTHTDFTNRLNPLINAHLKNHPKAKVVAISDGADWIASWIKRDYPEALIILAFFHAMEKIGKFAGMVFSSAENRSRWVDNRKEEMADGRVDKVIMEIRSKTIGRRESITEKSRVITQYIEKNKYRMKYNEYRTLGHCIGSGAIESAISTVVQQRCKLVGQRWTKRVAAVLNVRAAFKSDKRPQVRLLINNQMGHSWVA